MPDQTGHLHLVARNGTTISGDGHRLTRTDIEGYFNGTPYRDEPALWDVVTGRSPRGYVIMPAGWVAITRCAADTQDACAELLTQVTAAGDVRHGREHRGGMFAGIRRYISEKGI